MPQELKYDRRHFLGTAAMSLGAVELAMIGLSNAQFSIHKNWEPMKSKNETDVTFGPLKQIAAGLLNTGYVEIGPEKGSPVILLHGWPYDIHSYAAVAPLL